VPLNGTAPPTGGAPTSYVIEVGSSAGLSNLVVFDTGNTLASFSTIGVGSGAYFVRVRARNAAGTSGPSNEFIVIVGGGPGPCTGPPGTPAGLTFSINGSIVTLRWTAASGQPTTYIIEAGSSPQTSNLANLSTGNAGTGLSAAAPPGTFYVRVRARNACGTSGSSNEIIVIVGGVPGPPTGLTSAVNGAIVTLNWIAPGGQTTTYVIQAGSSSGASNLANFATGSTATTLTAAAPPGTYFVRVRARNPFGTSGPSNEIVVVVP
jgi:predicted phage tail protein